MNTLDSPKKKSTGRGAFADEAPSSSPSPTLAQPGDARFTTWRPGSGPPPVLPPSPPSARSHRDAPEPDPTVLEREPIAVAAPPAPFRDVAAVPASPLDDFFYREGEEAPAIGAAAEGPAPFALDGEREATEREEYLTFLLGEEEYAVAIELVREVLKSPPVTEVPRAPAHVLGVVTVRGEVVAVVDPRRRLGLPDAAARGAGARLVIVDAGDGPCALLVDGVANVVRLRPGSVEPRPQGFGGAAAECLAGIGRERGRLFTVLDLGALLRRAAAPRRGGEGRAHAGA
jgi:purine-binding chemotaxis protein CheW